MTTSHHYSGFWFHITWSGNTGTDQRGRKWSNPSNPVCDTLPWIKEICEAVMMPVHLKTKTHE